MSGPENGKYLIQPDLLPSTPVGVRNAPAPVIPVITASSDNIFTVTRVGDDKYTLVLKETDTGPPRFVIADEDSVVGITILDESESTSSWIISGSGGRYVISEPTKLIGVVKCWTVHSSDPGLPVILESYPVVPGFERPKWLFIKQ